MDITPQRQTFTLSALWHNLYPADVRCEFSIYATGETLYLDWQVNEEHVLAQVTDDNGPVCEDSCVEAFLQLPQREEYINFEFSCIGVCHAAIGVGRHQRTFIPPDVLTTIKRRSSLGKHPLPLIESPEGWSLNVEIPVSLFNPYGVTTLDGEWRGNFYKCGDKLPRPHFYSLFPVKTDEPDFHRPEYFNQLIISTNENT